MSKARATNILKRARGGDKTALNELMPLVFDQLRELAVAYFRQQPSDHTLQPTALVHEAYLRLVDQASLEWKDRSHFLGIAARAMRQVLVDYARQRNAEKRGGDRVRVPLGMDLAKKSKSKDLDVLWLAEVLEELGDLHARQARVVELRFLGGLTIDEAAEVLGVSPKTVEADWYGARAWLRRKLDQEQES